MAESLKEESYSGINLEEKPSRKKWLVFGILVLIVIIAFLVFSNPKSLGLAGLPELNFESTSKANESQESNELLEAIAKPFETVGEGIAKAFESLNPFSNASNEREFQNVQLKAVLETESFEVKLQKTMLECKNGMQVKEAGKETRIIAGSAIVQGFEGTIKQNTGLLALNGFVQDINAENITISFIEKQGIQITSEECETETALEEFTASVTGSIETEKASIKLENEAIELKGFKGKIAFKENGIEFNGIVDSLNVSTLQENIRVE